MRTIILAHAEQEFIEAVEYYNAQCPGLGYEFAIEITNTLERIASFPEAWPHISPRARRCITNKFPYGVIYQIKNDNILVVAIMHMKRKPIHWRNR
jgi:plasmid stabilization system protein ParE